MQSLSFIIGRVKHTSERHMYLVRRRLFRGRQQCASTKNYDAVTAQPAYQALELLDEKSVSPLLRILLVKKHRK